MMIDKQFKHTIVASVISSLAWVALPSFANGFHTENGGTTGGDGGQVVRATTGTQIHAALCNRVSSDTPITIQVEGTINHGNTSKVSGPSCNTAADKIELKNISNVTLIGVGQGALFDELGIHIRSSSNIIIRNVHVRNVKKSGFPTSNGGDAIGMEKDVSNVWVDHVTLEASGGESDGYDALVDMKNDTKYVTVSYSILRNSGRGGLVGSSDSDDNNGPVTFHHNYYENINSRTPLLRHATAHSYNNYYDGLISSGMNPRIGGKIKAENNYVKDSKDPLGTFYTNDMGFWDVSGNIWNNVRWSNDGNKVHPAGPNPVSTTSIGIPYQYQPDQASCVPAIVMATAGADKGLAVSDGRCHVTPGDDHSGNGNDNGGDQDNGGGSTSGSNLALNAGADGSSKGNGTSYGNVTDGDSSSYWSPRGTTGTISVKRLNQTINAVRIIELSGTQGTVTSWSLVNHDDGATLASGSSIPSVISFPNTNLDKISFVIHSASGTPAIAEFEVYKN
ncbi:pectate lyase family protein [Vibrio spartinae]|uniref:Pectate trisaccharide-lyase n=1 Tax=Vibrio spartinae TaxID=1918945 RepID=A0A1N6M5R8_9VIBR|nr:polysaccharide lyase family 1 protein [Vibrio spartinae]SIO94730.1 Pectate trisaccharide-lyase precursor [Vibrio spartinae]